MKSRLLALNPIKIQNRLIPNSSSPHLSLHNNQTKSQTEISSHKKIENVVGLDPISPLRKVITDPGTQSSIKVTIHRSNTLKRTDSVQSSSEQLSQSNDSLKDVSQTVEKQHEDLFQKPPKQLIIRARQQSSSLRTVNQVISSEYYNEIDNRINNGIKKLKEMDKRLIAYENRQQQSSNLIINETQKQTNSSRLNTSSQLRQTIDSMTKKKEDYLQQILYKSRKLKELEETLLERNKKITQLENQIKINNIKINKLQQNTKGYLQSQQNYKINVTKLLLQIQTKNLAIETLKKEDEEKRKKLELRLQEKTKQINTKSNQYVLKVKKQLQTKQAVLLEQIEKYREENNKIMANYFEQKQQQIENIKQQYEEKLNIKTIQHMQIIKKYQQDKLKEKQSQSEYKAKFTQIISQLQKNIEIKSQQLKQYQIKFNRKSEELQIINKQLISKNAEIYLKNSNLKQQINQKELIQENLNRECSKRQELENKTNKLEDQLKKLQDLIFKNESIVQKLTSDVQIREKQFMLSLDGYEKQNKELQKICQTLKAKNKTLEEIIQNIQNSKQSKELKQKEKFIQYGILQSKLKQFQTFNLQNLMKIADLENQILKSNQQLLKNKAENERILNQKQNLLLTLKEKSTNELNLLQQSYQTKKQTNEIKIKEIVQQNQKLKQQVNLYFCKISQNKNQLEQSLNKLKETQNLLQKQEKLAQNSKFECEKLIQQAIHYDLKIKQIEEATKQYAQDFSKLVQNINNNEIEEKKEINNQFKKIIQNPQNISLSFVLKIIEKLYKETLQTKNALQKENRKLKKQIINIPQKDILPKIILKTQIGFQTQIKTQQKQTVTEKYDNVNVYVQALSYNQRLAIYQNINIKIESNSSDQNKVKISGSQAKTQKIQIAKQKGKLEICEKMMSTNDTQLGGATQQDYIEQITVLKQDISDKQHIIEVMQSCIDDYKLMINDMKSKLQFQERIQCQYNEVLEFFEIDPQKTLQAAHEELLQLISVLMSKLENTVQAIKQLEKQLVKVNHENFSMKQKKKKILKEIKKYEQMAERACIQNQQLKIKNLQLTDKLDGASVYMKELNSIIDETNEDMLNLQAKTINLKYQITVQNDQEMNEMSIIQADSQLYKTAHHQQKGIDSTVEGVSPINNKRISEMALESVIDEQQYNGQRQSKQNSLQQQIFTSEEDVIKTPQPKQKEGSAEDLFVNKSPDVLQYKAKSQNEYDSVRKESENEQDNEN